VPMSGPKAFSHSVVASTRRSWAAWEKRTIVDEAQRAICLRGQLSPRKTHPAQGGRVRSILKNA
jgi:hypothetical protein